MRTSKIVSVVVSLGLGVSAIILAWTTHHRSYDITDGVVVHLSGGGSFSKEVETGRINQFWGDQSDCPAFCVENRTDQAQAVSVRSLCAWEVPFRGTVRLEPGQKFSFSPDLDYSWWVWFNASPTVN